MPPTVTYPPADRYTHTVIFLHGRGDTARNFATTLLDSVDSKGNALALNYHTTRRVFPEAEMRPRAPPAFPGEQAPQWFEVYNNRDHSEHEERQIPMLRDSVVRLRRIVLFEGSLLKGSAKAQRMPFDRRPLAETSEVLGLDGGPGDGNDEVLRNTLILLEHCVDDDVVGIGHGRALRDTLQAFGAQVTWKGYATGGHWFKSPNGMDDVKEFLEQYVGLRAGGFRF